MEEDLLTTLPPKKVCFDLGQRRRCRQAQKLGSKGYTATLDITLAARSLSLSSFLSRTTLLPPPLYVCCLGLIWANSKPYIFTVYRPVSEVRELR